MIRRFSFCLLLLFPALQPTASAASCDPLRFDQAQNLGTFQSSDITEASGLAASWRNPGVFWTHNDGPTDVLFAITSEGRLLGKYHMNKSTDDVEDVAVGPGPADGVSYIYAADIGSNDASRTKVKIVRAPEPAVSTSQDYDKFDLDQVDTFELKYPDGSFDAEALLIDPIARELFVVTKETDGATVFRIALAQMDPKDSQTLELVAHLSFARPSGGAVSRDGHFVALRREDAAEGWYRPDGEDLAQTLQRAATVIPVVGPPVEPNGEGITFLLDNSGYVTSSEGEGQALYFFRRIPPDGELRFIGAPRLTPQGVEMDLSGCAGENVSLERSRDLRDWSQVAAFQSNGGTQTVRDALSNETAFYRLRSD